MWLRINEHTDVINSLSFCLTCLKRVDAEPHIWKWATIALHSGLQGAMVCHLTGTDNLGALTKESAKKWMDWHDRDRNGEIKRTQTGIDEYGFPITEFTSKEDRPPDKILAKPSILFERLYSIKTRCGLDGGGMITVTEDQKRSFRKINLIRNHFVHFSPKS